MDVWYSSLFLPIMGLHKRSPFRYCLVRKPLVNGVTGEPPNIAKQVSPPDQCARSPAACLWNDRLGQCAGNTGQVRNRLQVTVGIAINHIQGVNDRVRNVNPAFCRVVGRMIKFTRRYMFWKSMKRENVRPSRLLCENQGAILIEQPPDTFFIYFFATCNRHQAYNPS